MKLFPSPRQWILGSLCAGLVFASACTQKLERPATADVSDMATRDMSVPSAEIVVDRPALHSASQDQALAKRSAERAEARHRKDLAKALASAPLGQSAAAGAGVFPVFPGVAPRADRENYASIDRNGVIAVSEQPVSTFSLDVDTGSYANVRRFLDGGRLPPRDAVRIEEMINYFDYAHRGPKTRSQPFALSTEIAPTPWNARTLLLQIGVQAWLPDGPAPASNLVFLVDVSGSMHSLDKLPLVKAALRMLSQEMSARDRISLVVYAGATGVVLPPTPGNQSDRISAALERLRAGGSTNGGAGIDLAYALAREAYIDGGVNRVILATDGDFNVGVTRFESLLDKVRRQREGGIALTTLGFGQGNYNDHLMEQLADAGDGNHAYIDSVREAHKVLVRQRQATLQTVARDAKVQIEFNPAQVAEYRLIGYENRMLAREDFDNDKVDAGDIGAGHSITALYEIALRGQGGERLRPLRYAQAVGHDDSASEIAHLRLRYKPVTDASAQSRLIERPLHRSDILQGPAASSEHFRLAAAVAGFGQLLAGDVRLGGFDYTDVSRLLGTLGDDPYGDRAGLRQLVEQARALTRTAAVTDPKIGG